jgi:RNA polymerase sigma-70 factor (ECF subfamily)
MVVGALAVPGLFRAAGVMAMRLTRPRIAPSIEAELMTRVQRGEPRAVELLYDQYAARLLGLALRMVRERAVAEELVQEAFLRAWRRAESFDAQRGDTFHWLASIVRNACLDHFRRQRVRPPMEEVDEEWELRDAAPDVAETAEVRAQRRAVQHALTRLPPEQREVLELSYYGGYTRRQIAARLNLPEGTIHTRARLGLLKLRELLAL